ncbi:MAG: GMC family oxidoreductase [Pseudomonadales bacterium]|nr:GMC family oxidoreductase [Pseudomonadales bacterium]
MSFEESFDFIVIGGGSSGCIVAAQLAKANLGKVLLLEAGDWAEKNPETLSADGFIHAFANDQVMWDRLSAKQASCGNRHLYMGSGTGMGGSGSVNGMVYTRGDKKDYEQWPAGWHWDDVEPAFNEVEKVLKVKPRDPTRYTETCIAAAKDAGFKQKDELLDGDLCGYLGYQTMNYDESQRRSSYVSFLKDKFLDNLTIKTKCKVRQITFNKSKRATGIVYSDGDSTRYAKASKEIVLCSGALETPKLLMVSGVGPADQLGKFNIEKVAESPMIGSNLHDHPNVCVFFKGRNTPDSKYPQLYGFNRVNQRSTLQQDQADTCFVFYSAPASLKQSMKRMLPAVLLPPSLFKNGLLRRFLRRCVDIAYALPILNKFLSQLYGVVVILGKPESRGRLTLRSANIEDQAILDPNYYGNSQDMETMVKGVQLAKAIAEQGPLKEWGNVPLVAGARTDQTNKIAKWIKDATMTTFHYCGTCKMGADLQDPVDLELKVRGVKGLRVADASVIPTTPVSALNAPSMMIGYRAASMIAEDYGNAQKSKVKNINSLHQTDKSTEKVG